MACQKCKKFEGDSTTHYSIFEQVFKITKQGSSSMTEGGIGKCLFCAQKIIYDYDETLIPKLRIEFVNDISKM